MAEPDLEEQLKILEQELQILEINEYAVQGELQDLNRQLPLAEEKLKLMQSVPLVVAEFVEMVDQNHCIICNGGRNYYCRILSTINCELLKPLRLCSCAPFWGALVDVLPYEGNSRVMLVEKSQKPDVTYNDIGGYDIQKQELREAIKLPLTHPQFYKQICIDPPNGVLLYGPPGTGKTMFAKAVANHTTATFIHLVGSEFAKRYLGEVHSGSKIMKRCKFMYIRGWMVLIKL